jgi:hypothetical protein
VAIKPAAASSTATTSSASTSTIVTTTVTTATQSSTSTSTSTYAPDLNTVASVIPPNLDDEYDYAVEGSIFDAADEAGGEFEGGGEPDTPFTPVLVADAAISVAEPPPIVWSMQTIAIVAATIVGSLLVAIGAIMLRRRMNGSRGKHTFGRGETPPASPFEDQVAHYGILASDAVSNWDNFMGKNHGHNQTRPDDDDASINISSTNSSPITAPTPTPSAYETVFNRNGVAIGSRLSVVEEDPPECTKVRGAKGGGRASDGSVRSSMVNSARTHHTNAPDQTPHPKKKKLGSGGGSPIYDLVSNNNVGNSWVKQMASLEHSTPTEPVVDISNTVLSPVNMNTFESSIGSTLLDAVSARFGGINISLEGALEDSDTDPEEDQSDDRRTERLPTYTHEDDTDTDQEGEEYEADDRRSEQLPTYDVEEA